MTNFPPPPRPPPNGHPPPLPAAQQRHPQVIHHEARAASQGTQPNVPGQYPHQATPGHIVRPTGPASAPFVKDVSRRMQGMTMNSDVHSMHQPQSDGIGGRIPRPPPPPHPQTIKPQANGLPAAPLGPPPPSPFSMNQSQPQQMAPMPQQYHNAPSYQQQPHQKVPVPSHPQYPPQSNQMQQYPPMQQPQQSMPRHPVPPMPQHLRPPPPMSGPPQQHLPPSMSHTMSHPPVPHSAPPTQYQMQQHQPQPVQHSMQHQPQQQQVRPLPPQPPKHLQDKDKIDPSQIPRVPLFTRPHQAPSAIIYPSTPAIGSNLGVGNNIANGTAPPPADSRYLAPASINANPRLLRSSVYHFPRDGATQRKVGVPLGIVVTPLAALTELCGGINNENKDGDENEYDGTSQCVRNLGDIYSRPNTEIDYQPISSSHPDPERVPVITSQYPVNPPRCRRCHAYLNPHCFAPPSRNMGGGYSPIQKYDCNFCSTKQSIDVPDEYISQGLVDKVMRNGTVEYEVSGAYIVRKPVENVRLFALEYRPEFDSGQQEHQQRHHGILKSNEWRERLEAVREVVEMLRNTTPKSVKVGVFAFCQNMLVFPYIKSREKTSDGAEEDADEEPEMEIGVNIVSDVEDDPFCPLPLNAWTYDVSGNDMDWVRFCHVVDSLTEIMEMLTIEYARKDEDWTRNCGGAAMVALVDALKDSGGKATLITTRRPNYGVGALRDREAGQQSQYMRAQTEKRLFTPLQHLTFTATALKAGEEKDRQASLFYKQLGEDAAKSRASLDIVVTSSLLKPAVSAGQHIGPGSGNTNLREFLDVATLAEVCRISCGKFKWLRVGNECGIAIGDSDIDNTGGSSFTKEQLREELKRSALAFTGSDAVFKLRCSNGIQVKSYSPMLPTGKLVGDGIVDSAELEMSSLDSSTTVAVLLEHKIGGIVNTLDTGKKDSPMVFFQAAVLYTTLTGKRRVRVTTIGLPTTQVASDVFRSADLGTVATLMSRQAVSDVIPSEDGLKSARFNVFDQCVTILANYRMNTNARSSSSGQLILPESLQLLPLFCLSLRKSRMFRHSLQSNTPSVKPSPTADERAYHLFYASMVTPNIALQCIHPNVFQISDMRVRDGEWITPSVLQVNKFIDENVTAASMQAVCQIPKSTNPSMTCLDENGMYILDDRFALYLFVGKDVQEEKWRDLISVELNHVRNAATYNKMPVGYLTLASTEAAQKIRNILVQLRTMNAPNPSLSLTSRPTHAPLILVFVGRGSVFEAEMDSLLIDDPDSHEKSYVDFLCTVHRAIRDKNASE